MTKKKLVEKYFLRPTLFNKSFSGQRKRKKKAALKQIENGIYNLSLLDYAKNIAFKDNRITSGSKPKLELHGCQNVE